MSIFDEIRERAPGKLGGIFHADDVAAMLTEFDDVTAERDRLRAEVAELRDKRDACAFCRPRHLPPLSLHGAETTERDARPVTHAHTRTT